MAQTSFALMTTLGRAKEAAALANATTIEITHIAIGDGATVPSGGETALYHELVRKTISGHGTVVGASNTAYFDIFLAADDGPYTIREAGLIDSAGDLIAIAHYDPPISKPVPASGQTVEGTVRLEVAFSDIASIVIKVDPAMKVALQRLTRLPWVPVLSMTTAAPPASPAVGDTYVIAADPTGAWAGQAGKLAEYTVAGWAIIAPPNGHGISLPDGRIFIRLAGAYVELASSTDMRGLIELATKAEAVAGTDTQRAVTPEGSLAVVASRLQGGTTSAGATDDWNNLTDWGVAANIKVGTAPHGPGGGGYYLAWILQYQATNIVQIAIPYADAASIGGGIWLRGRYDGTWSDWCSAGRPATQAEADSGVRGDVFLSPATARDQAALYVSAQGQEQSIPSGAYTTITDMTTLASNLDDATFAGGALTIGPKSAGKWQISTLITMATMTEGRVSKSYVAKNGSNIAFCDGGRSLASGPYASSPSVAINIIFDLADGDVITYGVLQTDDTSIVLSTNGTFFNAVRLGG